MKSGVDVAADSNLESRIIVRVLKKEGHTQKAIAEAAGVCAAKVSNIVRLKRGSFTEAEKKNIEKKLGVNLKKLMESGTGRKYSKVKNKISEFHKKYEELVRMLEDLLEDEAEDE